MKSWYLWIRRKLLFYKKKLLGSNIFGGNITHTHTQRQYYTCRHLYIYIYIYTWKRESEIYINIYLHVQTYSLYMYVHVCVYIYIYIYIYLIHTHLCIYMCMCVYMYIFEFTEKANPHTWQENGFSPLCVLMCLFKIKFWENTDPQCMNIFRRNHFLVKYVDQHYPELWISITTHIFAPI